MLSKSGFCQHSHPWSSPWQKPSSLRSRRYANISYLVSISSSLEWYFENIFEGAHFLHSCVSLQLWKNMELSKICWFWVKYFVKKMPQKTFAGFSNSFCGIEWGSSMVFAIGIGSNYFCQVSGSALQCSCKIQKISAFSDPHNKVIQAQLYFLFPWKNIHQSLMMIACKATGFLFLLFCWCVQANEIQTLLSGFRVVD